MSPRVFSSCKLQRDVDGPGPRPHFEYQELRVDLSVLLIDYIRRKESHVSSEYVISCFLLTHM